jgi:hypothetical protein
MLGKQTVDILKRLVSDGPQAVSALAWTDDGAKVIAVFSDAADARIDLADLDRFSAALRELAVTRHAAPVVHDMRAWLSDHAAATIRALSFLEEPLAVWELEESEGIAQLRSSPPHREAGEVTYWEVVLRCAEQPSASLARYRWAAEMPEREQVAYPATFALIGRMTAALESALTCEA